MSLGGSGQGERVPKGAAKVAKRSWRLRGVSRKLSGCGVSGRMVDEGRGRPRGVNGRARFHSLRDEVSLMH